MRIDKNRKIPITTFIRALLKMQDDKATMTGDGLTDQYGTDQEVSEIFGEDERLVKTIQDKDNTKNGEEGLLEVYRKLPPLGAAADGRQRCDSSAKSILRFQKI